MGDPELKPSADALFCKRGGCGFWAIRGDFEFSRAIWGALLFSLYEKYFIHALPRPSRKIVYIRDLAMATMALAQIMPALEYVFPGHFYITCKSRVKICGCFDVIVTVKRTLQCHQL
jgi:hypothetical protein